MIKIIYTFVGQTVLHCRNIHAIGCGILAMMVGMIEVPLQKSSTIYWYLLVVAEFSSGP